MNDAKHKKFFDSQDPDENIILVVRKHGIVLASSFIVAGIFILIVSILYGVAEFTDIIKNELARAITLAIVSLLVLFTLLYAFIGWLIKYLDILILTSKHLVIIRQDGLFKRGMSVLDLSCIQDVATMQHGVLQTFLGYGKVDVQTAGEAPNFAYNGVGNPNEIQDAIMDAKEVYVNHDSNISSPVVKNANQATQQMKNQVMQNQNSVTDNKLNQNNQIDQNPNTKME